MTWLIDPLAPLKPAPEYLAWVRSQPSAATGMVGCIAHHRIGYRHSQRKVDDFQTLPLTDAEHKRLHDKGVHEFEQECGSTEWEMIGRTLHAAVKAGVLVLDKKRAHALGG